MGTDTTIAAPETRLLIGGEQVEGEGDDARGREPRTPRRRSPRVATPSEDQVGAAIARRGRPSAAWSEPRRSSAPSCFTRSRPPSGAGRRSREADDARGRQAAGRELRRGRLDRCRVRLLRGDRPRLGGASDSLDRGDPAGPGGQGAGRRRRLHRAVELSAAAPGLEAGAGAGRRQHHGLQAVGVDAAVDPGAGACFEHLPPGVVNLLTGAGDVGRPNRRRRGRRLRGLHRVGATPGSGSPPPAPSGSRGSTSRWAARTPSSSAPTSPSGSTSPPREVPGPRS